MCFFNQVGLNSSYLGLRVSTKIRTCSRWLSLLQLNSHTLPSFKGRSERLNAFSLLFSGETRAKSIDSGNWEYDIESWGFPFWWLPYMTATEVLDFWPLPPLFVVCKTLTLGLHFLTPSPPFLRTSYMEAPFAHNIPFLRGAGAAAMHFTMFIFGDAPILRNRGHMREKTAWTDKLRYVEIRQSLWRESSGAGAKIPRLSPFNILCRANLSLRGCMIPRPKLCPWWAANFRETGGTGVTGWNRRYSKN